MEKQTNTPHDVITSNIVSWIYLQHAMDQFKNLHCTYFNKSYPKVKNSEA